VVLHDRAQLLLGPLLQPGTSLTLG
jgi:hypothetical protein